MLVMCEWPKVEPPQLQGMMEDLVTIVTDWVACQPIRFWTFPSWLAAMLAGKSEALASAYVSKLFKAGLLQPCTDAARKKRRIFAHLMFVLLIQGSESLQSGLER
jgi:hypothetical protein